MTTRHAQSSSGNNNAQPRMSIPAPLPEPREEEVICKQSLIEIKVLRARLGITRSSCGVIERQGEFTFAMRTFA